MFISIYDNFLKGIKLIITNANIQDSLAILQLLIKNKSFIKVIVYIYNYSNLNQNDKSEIINLIYKIYKDLTVRHISGIEESLDIHKLLKQSKSFIDSTNPLNLFAYLCNKYYYISRIFTFKLKKVYICQNNKAHTYEKINELIYLKIDIETKINGLINKLNYLFSDQLELKKCKYCKENTKFTVKQNIIRIPKYLFLVINHGTNMDINSFKIKSEIKSMIKLSGYIYKLKQIIAFSATYNSYIPFIKYKDSWKFIFNNNIFNTNFDEIFQNKIIVTIFKKCKSKSINIKLKQKKKKELNEIYSYDNISIINGSDNFFYDNHYYATTFLRDNINVSNKDNDFDFKNSSSAVYNINKSFSNFFNYESSIGSEDSEITLCKRENFYN